VALHANHPRELTEQARAACARLVDAGIVLVSQTVLLKGVNDDAEVLAALMRAFVENRIRPYYLHHPDLAPGTGHFRLGLAEGKALVAQLRGRISGLCQPTYILDIPAVTAKRISAGARFASWAKAAIRFPTIVATITSIRRRPRFRLATHICTVAMIVMMFFE
jgi:L-lysine 2,3-aminomutase